MKRSIGIDLGTTNTRLYVKGKGIVLREPSYVAIDTHSYRVLAAGKEAYDMIGRTPGDMAAFRPLREGVIADFDVAVTMLRMFIEKAVGSLSLNQCRAILSVPEGVTEVEKRAVEEAALEAGAVSVALIESPVAAALGAGLPITEARGNMVVDMGGGITEAAVISMGSTVLSDSIRIGGSLLDDAIFTYIKYNRNILIGEQAAEELKINHGSVFDGKEREDADIRGRNLISGLPAVSKITSDELREAMSEQVERLSEGICGILEKTPPELASDIYDGGITLVGGGSLLCGFADLLNKKTGIRVHIAPTAGDCVVNGIGTLLDNESAGSTFLSFRSRPRRSFL